MPGPDFQVWCPEEFDLSGSAVSVPVWGISGMPQAWGNFNSGFVGVVKKVMVAYTEATPGSTDATYDNIISIGDNSNESQTTDYTIPASKSIGDIDVIDQASFAAEPRINGTRNYVQIKCQGGASGSGKVRVGLLVSQNFREWVDVVP